MATRPMWVPDIDVRLLLVPNGSLKLHTLETHPSIDDPRCCHELGINQAELGRDAILVQLAERCWARASEHGLELVRRVLELHVVRQPGKRGQIRVVSG